MVSTRPNPPSEAHERVFTDREALNLLEARNNWTLGTQYVRDEFLVVLITPAGIISDHSARAVLARWSRGDYDFERSSDEKNT